MNDGAEQSVATYMDRIVNEARADERRKAARELDTTAHVCPPLTLREAMVKLYAEAMEDSAEGALRWLASRYEERYDEPIPESHDIGSSDG
jgi:hypothetical protein